MSFLTGVFIGLEICLCTIIIGVFVFDAFKRRTSNQDYYPCHGVGRDAKKLSVPKALRGKVVYNGKVTSIYGTFN